MGKALLHELGRSLSFGRLSLRAKVLWPMLLATSDDQGRGLAEPDAVKWYVCPNVPEIAVDDVPALLGEMVEQGMIVVYDCDRDCSVYQIVRWWEYQELQWARPSKYSPPEDWTDRIRYSNRGDYHKDGWDTTGGFQAAPTKASDKEPPRKPGRKPPRNVGDEPGRVPTQPNLTKSNLTDNPNGSGANAPPPDGGQASGDEDSQDEGQGREPSMPTTFPEWQTLIKQPPKGSNRTAILKRMCEHLYPGLDPPSYSYIGSTSKKVGGAGRLADWLWQIHPHPPTGDLMAYIVKANQAQKARSNGSGKRDHPAEYIDDGSNPLGITGLHDDEPAAVAA